MNPNENFLQQNASAYQNPGTMHLNEDQKIQEILQQQQKMQILYNDIVVYIQQHQNMNAEDMLKYQAQLKQLSEQYQANQEQLKLLGYSNLQVNKDVVIKSGAKKNLSLKTIAIGCGAIIAFLVFGLMILFYYLLNNPAQLSGLSGIGITAGTAKQLLLGMTGTVMFTIAILGIIMIIMNTYKAFTVKNKSKIWYYFGIGLGIVILLLAVGAGAKVMGEVSKIEVESVANPNQTLLSYVFSPEKDNPNAYTQMGPQSLLIAPVNVGFKLLRQNYRRYVDLQLWPKDQRDVKLDCGNGQVLNFANDDRFSKACFYTQKGKYPITLIAEYLEWGQQKNEKFTITEVSVASQLNFDAPASKKVELSDNEVIVGPLPTEITFNADQIFRDLGLRNYHINWDGDGDGIADKVNDSSFIFSYEKAEVFYPRFSLPGINKDLYFSFPLRVEKSLTPVCKFNFEAKTATDYQVSVNFFDEWDRFISDYSYLLYDNSNKKLLEEFQGKDVGMDFLHRFPGKGSYLFKMNFITTEGKTWVCEWTVKITDKTSYQVAYDVLLSTPRAPEFKKIDVASVVKDKSISIVEVPTKIKLRLNTIEPFTYDTMVQVSFDERPVVETQKNEYLFDIRDSEEHVIKIKIQDKIRELVYEEVLKTKIWLDDIIGDLKVIGKEYSGFSPFTVTLDASATKLNDAQDEIAYFSWDFGDGQVKKNLSSSVIKHTYVYNSETNSGVYLPSVSVFTKSGRSATFSLDKPIIVNKQLVKLNLYSSSHPTQEARMWDKVVFWLDFNGLPTKVHWSFKEGEQPISCDGRECIEMTKVFEERGLYTVKVMMEFGDEQSVEQSMLFRVR